MQACEAYNGQTRWRYRGGYGMNWGHYLDGDAWPPTGACTTPAGSSEAWIEDPADTLLMVDSLCVVSGPGMNGGRGHWRFDPELADRHNDGCNYLFCDGHVKWLKQYHRPTDTFSPEPVPGMWTPRAGD
jgi:prepilin-type processing-associated H-X9-DG protein